MTVRRLSTRLLLRPGDLPPTRDGFEVIGVFNAGAVRTRDEVVLLARVSERPIEQRPGFVGLPRWENGQVVTDWLPNVDWEPVDTRAVRRSADGLTRLTFTSHLRVIRCGDGTMVREIDSTVFAPEGELEEFGVEDPRITPLDGQFHFTYVAVSRHGVATALASTSDFRGFERHGVIFCPENKDVVLFPERIGGAYAALHRPVGGAAFCRPEMWFARSPDLRHWGAHAPLVIPSADWQDGRVGAGPPPIRVNGGWLAIYHGNRHAGRPGKVGVYSGGALLLDGDDPTCVTHWAAEPILRPEADFESVGFVPNVVFPTGVVQSGDSLLVYLGAADTTTAVVEFSLHELLADMVAVN